MPKVTVNFGSGRPGGIDITLAGLTAQTFKDFEVIFVDGRYHQRHSAVLEAVRKSGLQQPFYHVPNHRYRSDSLGQHSAGYNTGFMLAAGEMIVMLHDYAYAPPHWLMSHVTNQDKKITLGPVESRVISNVITNDGLPPMNFFNRNNIDGISFPAALGNILRQRERYDEISAFRKPFTPDDLASFSFDTLSADPKVSMPSGPSTHMFFNTKNEAFPTEAILAVNGMDENSDRACIPGDLDLGLRLSRHLMATPWLVNEAILYCINPRSIMPKPINVMNPRDPLPPPYENYLSSEGGGYAYYERIAANPQILRAPNPFEIQERKKEIWHWREMSLLPEAVIPKNSIADCDYYKTGVESL